MRNNHDWQSVSVTPRLFCRPFKTFQKGDGVFWECVVPSPLSSRSIQHLVPVKKKNKLWIFRRVRFDVCLVATIWTVVWNLPEVHSHRILAWAHVLSLVAAIKPNHRVRKIKSGPQGSLEGLRRWLRTCSQLMCSTRFCLWHNRRRWLWWCSPCGAWWSEWFRCFWSRPSLCGWFSQDRNRFWCFWCRSSFCSRPFQDLNLLFGWGCLDFPNSCPL